MGGQPKITAHRIDVDPAAALIASDEAESFWLASLQNIHEHSFNAGFMEVVVLAKRNDVIQQRIVIDLWTTIVNRDTPNIGLPGDRTQAAQQVAVNVFLDMSARIDF